MFVARGRHGVGPLIPHPSPPSSLAHIKRDKIGKVSTNLNKHLINPRRACAARVTVVGLSVCVCLSVCLSTTILALQATYEAA